MPFLPTDVYIFSPNHRDWGNRVVREIAVLLEHNYSVQALMKTSSHENHNRFRIDVADNARGVVGRIFRLLKIIVYATRHKARLYHVHNPEMIPLALVLKLLGRKVIYDTHENYALRLMLRDRVPQSLKAPLGKFISAIEVFTSKIVDATFVTQEGQLETFSSKTYLLRNAPYLSQRLLKSIKVERSKIVKTGAVFRLIYVGGLSRYRGIANMLDSLMIINQSHTTRLWLAGPDLDGCLDKAQKHQAWKYVDYLGVLSHGAALAYMSEANLGLVVLSDIGDHASARPSKLFEYMAVGCPFISSDFKLWREFIEPMEPGWWIQPDDSALLAGAVLKAVAAPGELKSKAEQGREFIAKFNWQNESKVLLETYRKILGNRR